MGLRINGNTAAINATRQINSSVRILNTSLERISSGLPGALRNRLGFTTISTPAIQKKNTSSGESAIRDSNSALETTGSICNRILSSAGTSISEQTNVSHPTKLKLIQQKECVRTAGTARQRTRVTQTPPRLNRNRRQRDFRRANHSRLDYARPGLRKGGDMANAKGAAPRDGSLKVRCHDSGPG